MRKIKNLIKDGLFEDAVSIHVIILEIIKFTSPFVWVWWFHVIILTDWRIPVVDGSSIPWTRVLPELWPIPPGVNITELVILYFVFNINSEADRIVTERIEHKHLQISDLGWRPGNLIFRLAMTSRWPLQKNCHTHVKYNLTNSWERDKILLHIYM